MLSKNIKPAVNLFRAASLMEDDIVPGEVKSDRQDGSVSTSKFSEFGARAKQAISEKKAMVRRTKVARIAFLLDYNAKATEFAASDVFDILINEDAGHVAIVTATRSTQDELAVKPDGITILPIANILDVKITGLEAVAMAAASNIALAENKSANAQVIVDTLGLQGLVEDLRRQHQIQDASQQQTKILYLWYPVFGVPMLSGYGSQLPTVGDETGPFTPQEDITPSPFAYNDPASAGDDATIPDDQVDHPRRPEQRAPEQEPDPAFVPQPGPGHTREPAQGPRA